MILTSLLSSSSFIMTNKILIKAVGTDAAIILGELCSKYNYWEQRGQLTESEWFFSTRENIENNTGLSEYKQRVAITKLLNMKLIETKKMGIPCKIYYKLNENNILNCYTNIQKKMVEVAKSSVVENLDNKNLKDISSCDEIFQEQEEQNLDNNNNNNNNNHTHESNKLEKAEKKIEYAKMVTMTKEEHQDLINKYGEEMTKQLVEQLSLYKQCKGKSYNSDYAAILYWVIERVKNLEKKDLDYKECKKTKSKERNFEQREYPTGFLNSLYCNRNQSTGGKNEKNIEKI